MTSRVRQRPLPLVLIGLGLLLFLNGVGWLRVDGWALLNLWPLALIAAGVDLLLGGRYRLAVVLGALALGAVLASGGGAAWLGRAATLERVAQPLGGARSAEVHLQTGVSALHLDTAAEPGLLVSGTLPLGPNERVTQRFAERGGVAVFTLQSAAQRGLSVRGGGQPWRLSLNPSVPVRLSLDTGVGRAVLELREAQLSGLEVSTGVGETVLTLPRRGRYEAALDTGVGAATVRIPEGVAVRLEVSRGIGAVSVRGDFVRDGDLYRSPDYDTAEHRVDLRVRGGVGAITVERGG
ncbi:LiaF domain-containing protein [Truepera radiovictrix]|uniref:Uncharacterized protein n=1 Tax=Truepera radiovictrix (strain DSM 17093 / CIP 108686 / LMG 22925 / RQ-24) TaxID=649638 RepID=D7CQC4_TRURR|nr:LiaF domain-containing protein [Truepera radiovictrix]ADI14908.1 conserved hypothetical protein [Truepera radiovictrix DSM 17093]WMT56540.1 LiaF-related protein [Truepera radiovictrix]